MSELKGRTIARHFETYIEFSKADWLRIEDELKRYRALNKNLPQHYAIGDDATATLAVELEDVKEALRKVSAHHHVCNECADLVAKELGAKKYLDIGKSVEILEQAVDNLKKSAGSS